MPAAYRLAGDYGKQPIAMVATSKRLARRSKFGNDPNEIDDLHGNLHLPLTKQRGFRFFVSELKRRYFCFRTEKTLKGPLRSRMRGRSNGADQTSQHEKPA